MRCVHLQLFLFCSARKTRDQTCNADLKFCLVITVNFVHCNIGCASGKKKKKIPMLGHLVCLTWMLCMLCWLAILRSCSNNNNRTSTTTWGGGEMGKRRGRGNCNHRKIILFVPTEFGVQFWIREQIELCSVRNCNTSYFKHR